MFEALLGHLAGDYLFQTKHMALNKGEDWRVCFVHVLVYTICVCGIMGWYQPWQIGAVAIPHYIIDRTSFANTWLHFIRGRSFQTVSIDAYKRELDLPFTCFVYAVTDNTMHLFSLYAVWRMS